MDDWLTGLKRLHFGAIMEESIEHLKRAAQYWREEAIKLESVSLFNKYLGILDAIRVLEDPKFAQLYCRKKT